MINKKISDLKTELQIQFIKETFLSGLKEELCLHSVFAPLYVKTGTGVNDDLNGIEKPVSFNAKESGTTYTIVHSLAKWKRVRLKELAIPMHEGIITNMTALRPDESLSDIHSILVDQWDWEVHIAPVDRTLSFLKETVSKIYTQLKKTEALLSSTDKGIIPILPDEIIFIHSEDLYDQYPDKTSKERENIIAEKYKAVFLIGVGRNLADGEPHDGRAPDYDDWSTQTDDKHYGLNGDIILWHSTLKRAFEVSSMGIRVDPSVLLHQLAITNTEGRKELSFHKDLLEDKLPLSIGGGIGQSRLCMFMLRKNDIAEVQYCDN